MNHYYTSVEEYIFAFFEANPTFDTFRPPAPPHHSIYYPTWFTPNLTTPDLVHHTHDLDLGLASHISEQHTGVYSSHDQFKEVEATESPRLSRPSTPSALETRTPSWNHSKRGRKTVPSRRPRSRRAELGVRYSTFEDRLKVLEQDPFVLQIWEEENKVLCGGCRNRIQLDNRKERSLHLQNWNTHKRRCFRRKDKEQQLTELIRQGLPSPPSSSGHD